jgi:hypothetical protein
MMCNLRKKVRDRSEIEAQRVGNADTVPGKPGHPNFSVRIAMAGYKVFL